MCFSFVCLIKRERERERKNTHAIITNSKVEKRKEKETAAKLSQMPNGRLNNEQINVHFLVCLLLVCRVRRLKKQQHLVSLITSTLGADAAIIRARSGPVSSSG